jgi:hypothetical protein
VANADIGARSDGHLVNVKDAEINSPGKRKDPSFSCKLLFLLIAPVLERPNINISGGC